MVTDIEQATPRSRVYVMDMNSYDYTPAEAYGDLVMLRAEHLAPGIALDDSWNAGIVTSLRKQLLDYRPMTDYLIPTGKPLKIVLISMLAVERGSRHRILAWDQKYYRYIQHIVDLLKPDRGELNEKAFEKSFEVKVDARSRKGPG